MINTVENDVLETAGDLISHQQYYCGGPQLSTQWGSVSLPCGLSDGGLRLSHWVSLLLFLSMAIIEYTMHLASHSDTGEWIYRSPYYKKNPHMQGHSAQHVLLLCSTPQWPYSILNTIYSPSKVGQVLANTLSSHPRRQMIPNSGLESGSVCTLLYSTLIQ